MEVRKLTSDNYQDIYERTMTKISQGVSQTLNNSKVSSEEFVQILSYFNDQLNQSDLKNSKNCFIGIGKDLDGQEMGFLGNVKKCIIINDHNNLSTLEPEFECCVSCILQQIDLENPKYKHFAIVIMTTIDGHDIPITVTSTDSEAFYVKLLEKNKIVNYENFQRTKYDCWRTIPII